MKRLIVTLFALVLTSAALAQTNTQPCDPETVTNCTIPRARAFYAQQAAAATAAATAEEALNATAARSREEMDVVTANRAQTAPQTFAAHIHNSYEDFLNLFNFAINKVDESENGQALIIRFNPLRQGSLLIGTTLTVAQPTVADVVKNAIPEASRDSTVSALDKLQGNRNDLTFSVAASGATTRCDPEQPATRCWGRTPSSYRPIVDLLLLPLVRSHRASGALTRRMLRLFPNQRIPLANQVISDAGPNRAEVITLLKQEVGLNSSEAASARELYEANHLDLIATMIDNQPQASGTISIHRPPTYGGPRSAAGTVELHFGRMNINTLRGMCSGKSDDLSLCLHDALASIAESGMATDKWVFNASYDRLQHYRLDSLGLDKPVAGFTPINAPQSDVLKVKGQGGWQLGTAVMGKPTRADFSLEGGFNQKGNVRSSNRWVGTATFSIPFGDMMTVPVSVTWANKSEFIGEVKNRIGAHIGLTYRLPMLLGSK